MIKGWGFGRQEKIDAGLSPVPIASLFQFAGPPVANYSIVLTMNSRRERTLFAPDKLNSH